MMTDYLCYFCPEIQLSLDEHTLYFLLRLLTQGNYEKSSTNIERSQLLDPANGWVDCGRESPTQRRASELVEWRIICNMKDSGSLINYRLDRRQVAQRMFDPMRQLTEKLYDRFNQWKWTEPDNMMVYGVGFLSSYFRNEGYSFHTYPYKSWWKTFDSLQCLRRKKYSQVDFLHRCNDRDSIFFKGDPRMSTLKEEGSCSTEADTSDNRQNVGVLDGHQVRATVMNAPTTDVLRIGDSGELDLSQLYYWGIAYCRKLAIKYTVVQEAILATAEFLTDKLIRSSIPTEINMHLLFSSSIYLYIAMDCNRNEWSPRRALRAASAATDGQLLFGVCIRLLMNAQRNFYSDRRLLLSQRKGGGSPFHLSKAQVDVITSRGTRNVSWDLPLNNIVLRLFSRFLHGPELHEAVIWKSYKYHLIRLLESAKRLDESDRTAYIDMGLAVIHKGAVTTHNMSIYMRAFFLVMLNTCTSSISHNYRDIDGSLSLLLAFRCCLITLFVDVMAVSPTRYVVPSRVILACMCLSVLILDHLEYRSEYDTHDQGKSFIYCIVRDSLRTVYNKKPVICSCSISLCMHSLSNMFMSPKSRSGTVSYDDIYDGIFQTHHGFTLICSLLAELSWTVEIMPICHIICRLHREGVIKREVESERSSFQRRMYEKRFELLRRYKFEELICS